MFRVWDPLPFHADADKGFEIFGDADQGLVFFFKKFEFFLLEKVIKALDPDPDPRTRKNPDPDPGTQKMRIRFRNPEIYCEGARCNKRPKHGMVCVGQYCRSRTESGSESSRTFLQNPDRGNLFGSGDLKGSDKEFFKTTLVSCLKWCVDTVHKFVLTNFKIV